ncbi:MAG: glycosyltransferase [Acidobacteriota bacterium]
MLSGEDIICFANDWDADPLSKKHIMTLLAKHNRILWINSIGNRNPTLSNGDLHRIIKKVFQFVGGLRQVQQNIWTFTPILLPFHGSLIARIFNLYFLTATIRLLCLRLGFRNPITWTFVPTSADVVGHLGEKLILYHCVDEYSQFSDASQQTIAQIEEKLLRKSDLVIVSANKLYQTKRSINPKTYLIQHGVDVEHFAQACDTSLAIAEDIAYLPHPIIGFHGLIASWIDLELIEQIARIHPDWSIVLLGKIQSHDGNRRFDQRLKNIYCLGHQDYTALPSFCKAFDVAIIPFVVNELTLNANPLKMREYLAAGLPVVSTNIPEAQALGKLVSIATDRSDFIHQIEVILTQDQVGPRLARSRQMHSESWQTRVAEISAIVQQHLVSINDNLLSS